MAHLHGLRRAGGARREDQHERVARCDGHIGQRRARVRRDRVGPRAVGAVDDEQPVGGDHRLGAGIREQRHMRPFGEQQRAVGVLHVTRQLRAPAGRVDADERGAGHRARAQREPELGDVVEQHPDMERCVDGLAVEEERGARRDRVEHFPVRPRRVFEAQRDAVAADVGAEQVGDRGGRVHLRQFGTRHFGAASYQLPPPPPPPPPPEKPPPLNPLALDDDG